MAKKLIVVRSSSANTCRFVFWFGVSSPTYILAYGRGIEDALDEAIEWVGNNKPGLLCDKEVADLFKEYIAEGETEEDAQNMSEADTYHCGDNNHYVNSDEWRIIFENPQRAELKAWLAD
jgi:5'-deoxynucleotidase YfbR-like HD superfamily hydrolase